MESNSFWTIVSEWLTAYSINLLSAIIVLLAGRWLAKKVAELLNMFLTKSKVDATLVGFLQKMTYYTLLVLVVFAAAEQLGINTTSFLTIIAAAGLAVGLALKDSLANFAAGVMLILFRPFRIGDTVEAGGVEGSVETISIFNTIMQTPDNRMVIVPNGKIINDVITNVTANPIRRIDLIIGISYEDNIGRAREVLNALLAEDNRILKEPAPVIAVAELSDSGVNLAVRPWVIRDDYLVVRGDLLERIKTAFDLAGLTIPYPRREVNLRQSKI
jgi:small conductance mechanosensitive channel